MPSITVVLPTAEVAILAAGSAAVCVLPDEGCAVALGESPINVTVGDRSVGVVCDDVLAPTFTTPTLTSWSIVAEDLESLGARVHFQTNVTAGSPCRVKFKLVDGAASEEYAGKYSSPEQNTPHTEHVDITTIADRGLTYDLYWAWSSGMSSATWALVAANAVYVPINGEGDFPASG